MIHMTRSCFHGKQTREVTTRCSRHSVELLPTFVRHSRQWWRRENKKGSNDDNWDVLINLSRVANKKARKSLPNPKKRTKLTRRKKGVKGPPKRTTISTWSYLHISTILWFLLLCSSTFLMGKINFPALTQLVRRRQSSPTHALDAIIKVFICSWKFTLSALPSGEGSERWKQATEKTF